MGYLAEEIVTPGGPSAPAWAFFTAITLALIGIFGQQIAARRTAKETKDEVTKAVESASAAQENTVNVSDGFAQRMDRKLDAITKQQHETNAALRRHLEWHIDKERE
jgi:hypothetical protein